LSLRACSWEIGSTSSIGSGTTCWFQDQLSNQRDSGLVLPNAAFQYALLSLYRTDYMRIYL
jgi:hypothetical protein